MASKLLSLLLLRQNVTPPIHLYNNPPLHFLYSYKLVKDHNHLLFQHFDLFYHVSVNTMPEKGFKHHRYLSYQEVRGVICGAYSIVLWFGFFINFLIWLRSIILMIVKYYFEYLASKLYGVNATIIIFVFVLYCIILIHN